LLSGHILFCDKKAISPVTMERAYGQKDVLAGAGRYESRIISTLNNPYPGYIILAAY